MLYIPLNKAFVAVENENCYGCYFEGDDCNCNEFIDCFPYQRRDGKRVIFKLVDYKP